MDEAPHSATNSKLLNPALLSLHSWLGAETITKPKLCGMLLDVLKQLSMRSKNMDLQLSFRMLAPLREIDIQGRTSK